MNQENWNAKVAAKMAELDQAIEAGNFRLLPLDLKKYLMVRYRLVDIEAYEESCLVSSTKSVFKAMAQNSVSSFG